MTRRTLYPLTTWIAWALAPPLALMAAAAVVVAASDAEALLFDNPHLWWLGGAGPLAGFVFLYGVVRRRRALNRFASPSLAPLLALRISPTRQALRAGLTASAVLMIVAGVIGPRWGVYLEKQKVRGVDVVVALDVSRSMLARDVAPNRIERAKREIEQQLVERAVFRHANRLALLAFAGSTSLKLPLTTDHLAFRTKLRAVRVGDAPRGGTATASAIRKASDLFVKSPEEATKIILLLTDGEDHEGEPVAAAESAWKKQDIRVFTVGVGDPARTAGAAVPAGSDGAGKPLLYDGQIVFSKLDADGLRKIAVAAGGQYAPIQEFHRLVDRVAGLRKMELTTEERIRHKPRYQWFVATALLLLALETSIRDRRSKGDESLKRVWQQEFA